MTRGNTVVRTATYFATLATLAAAPAAAQPSAPDPAPSATPRQIAAAAHSALLMIHALSETGDTLGIGTGFVVSSDGLFVTNYHVIEEAQTLSVSLLDGGKYTQVSLVAADPASDLALMKVEARGLRPLRVGNDTRMEVGDKIYVMGNPLGMGGTFSDGMVSGKRPLEGVAMLQISAPISPGSSGGPVMNERGEVIGVATMMVMGGQNLNMAVPAHYLQPMMAMRAAPRPFSPAVLVSRPAAGLALVGGRPQAPRVGSGMAERGTRQPEREIQSQLDMIRPMLAMRGFVPAFPVQTGSAPRSQDESHSFTMEKGVSYIVTARCDAGCRDVDVTLYDGAGHMMGTDEDQDDFPTIGFTAKKSGPYRVTVRIKQCASEPCSYGVAVFSRDERTGQRAAAHPSREDKRGG
jgi:S1-C subfamily serine protease